MSRVAVIGLDGAEFTLVDQWMQEGKLPNLQKIQKSGFFCLLPSTIPPITYVAWTSYLTGKNPAKTGIFDFYQVKRDTCQIYYPNATYIQAETLPEILSQEGKSVGLINVPLTYPSPPVNGFNLPGLGAPDRPDLNYAHPPGLLKWVYQKTGQHYHPLPEPREFGPQYETLLKDIRNQLAHRRKIVPLLYNEFQPDFFCLVFSETDAVEHYFWKFMDPAHPQFNPQMEKKYGTAILKVFQQVDELIGEWLTLFGSDTDVFILSDHGMGPFYLAPDYLGYLSYRDLMHLKVGIAEGKRVLPRFFILYFLWQLGRNAFQWGKRHLPWTIRNFLNRMFPRPRSFLSTNFSFLNLIDWSRSKVYFADPRNIGYLYINLKGREPYGIVEPSEYEELCSFLISDLESLQVPGTDVPIVEKVYRREEVYSGPFFEQTPDLVIIWNLDAIKHIDLSQVERMDIPEIFWHLFQPLPVIPMGGRRRIPYNAFHTMRGIFLASGPAIKSNSPPNSPAIADLFPTILTLMDVSIPSDVDGRILWEILRQDVKKKKFPRYREPRHKASPVDYTAEQEERLKLHLRHLGYLE